MEQLIERLISIGYTSEKAESIYQLYARMGKLDNLESYISEKELIDNIL